MCVLRFLYARSYPKDGIEKKTNSKKKKINNYTSLLFRCFFFSNCLLHAILYLYILCIG